MTELTGGPVWTIVHQADLGMVQIILCTGYSKNFTGNSRIDRYQGVFDETDCQVRSSPPGQKGIGREITDLTGFTTL